MVVCTYDAICRTCRKRKCMITEIFKYKEIMKSYKLSIFKEYCKYNP